MACYKYNYNNIYNSIMYSIYYNTQYKAEKPMKNYLVSTAKFFCILVMLKRQRALWNKGNPSIKVPFDREECRGLDLAVTRMGTKN